MTLEELIEKYKKQEFELFKHKDNDDNLINTVFVFESQSDYLDKYLNYYKDLPNLTEVIVFATNGTFKLTKNGIEFFLRHNHQEIFKDREGNQRGVSREIVKIVKNNLITRFNHLMNASTFEQIMQIVTECKVKGFGELSIYDTSLRIAMFKGIEPDKVYLHAGTRKGFEVLEKKGYVSEGASKKKSLTKEELPKEFQKLKTYETENHSCLYKKEYEMLPNIKNINNIH